MVAIQTPHTSKGELRIILTITVSTGNCEKSFLKLKAQQSEFTMSQKSLHNPATQ